jgi:Spy/CpxP family protein refolding chaperone
MMRISVLRPASVISAALTLLCVTALGHAQVPGAAYPLPPGQPAIGFPGAPAGYALPPNPLADLKLTADQLAKMKEIGQAAEKNNNATVQKLAEQTVKLNEQMAVERPDPKSIGSLYAEVSSLQRQLLEAGVETNNQQMDVLTPEQKAKWRAFQQSVRLTYR